MKNRKFLGIELGSTRIKAVLIDEDHKSLASGVYDWENRLENGIWTYGLDEVHEGLAASFRALQRDTASKCGSPLKSAEALGISAMMHGYLVFDRNDRLLVPFRTWRNTITGQAASELTELFGFNIPQRWSIAHLYQAMLSNEPHIKDIAFLTTLSGYVHWKLTGKKVLGVGDASGMFPIDSKTMAYNPEMLGKFNSLLKERSIPWKLEDILPQVLNAGEDAGTLTEQGLQMLDPEGTFSAGVPLCPPEGDAGTGMVATNSIAERTGNVSAGTSIFAMAVLEKPLSALHPEIDMVTTPAGRPVAMAHANNCTSDFDAWVKLFGETVGLFKSDVKKSELYDALYFEALKGDPDCDGLLSYNYLSGRQLAYLKVGRYLSGSLKAVLRLPTSCET